jgi:four helix bundle protein
MNSREMDEKTKIFSVNVIRFVAAFPKNKKADVLGYQLLKSATSIRTNYKEAVRTESKTDFLLKLGVVEKEANETEHWLELVKKTFVKNSEVVESLSKECRELLALISASERGKGR